MLRFLQMEQIRVLSEKQDRCACFSRVLIDPLNYLVVAEFPESVLALFGGELKATPSRISRVS